MPPAAGAPHDPLAPARRLSVAPMLDWTTRDFRYFAPAVSSACCLYTGDGHDRRHPAATRPGTSASTPPTLLALQLGGSDPQALAACARASRSMTSADEINLNCGCPSDHYAGRALRRLPDGRAATVADCGRDAATGAGTRAGDREDASASTSRPLRAAAALRRNRRRRRLHRCS